MTNITTCNYKQSTGHIRREVNRAGGAFDSSSVGGEWAIHKQDAEMLAGGKAEQWQAESSMKRSHSWQAYMASSKEKDAISLGTMLYK